ncbi:hypothetical protein CR513_01033, partial [Mucuna pruriens]
MSANPLKGLPHIVTGHPTVNWLKDGAIVKCLVQVPPHQRPYHGELHNAIVADREVDSQGMRSQRPRSNPHMTSEEGMSKMRIEE